MFDINRMKLSENYWVFGRVLIFGDLIVVTSDVGRRLRVAPHYHLSVPNLRKKNFAQLLRTTLNAYDSSSNSSSFLCMFIK